jgi:hypothetical protein
VSAPGGGVSQASWKPGVEAASSRLSCAFRHLHRPLGLWTLKAAGSRFDVFCHYSSYRDVLCAEAREMSFIDPMPIKGGVTVRGGWPEIWRANLELRGASRVLARVPAFRDFHLAQLDRAIA